ncbi:MAG: lamin tail domain-containing protein [Verrucomicrobiota bacterium]
MLLLTVTVEHDLTETNERHVKKYLTFLITTSLFASVCSAQITSEAVVSATIEDDGINGTSLFFAQNNNSNFDEYSLAGFLLSQTNFGDLEVADISSAVLTLTVSDQFFSATGPFSILFTTDSSTDLGGYSSLLFDSNSTYGINASDFTDAPVVVGTGNYAFSGNNGGGTTVDISLDLSVFEAELIAAINAGEPFNLLIGSLNSDSTIATFAGAGVSGAPLLEITATTTGVNPEPSAHPTSFDSAVQFNSIQLVWVDSADAAGYVIQISETNSFSPVTDGTSPVEDLDLSDGAGQAVVLQGVQSLFFEELDESTEYFFRILPYSNLGVDTDYKTDGSPPTTSAETGNLPTGDLLITQYYEGTGNNKYLELTNVSALPIALDGLILTAWSNASTEDWKTGASVTTRVTPLDGITLAAGSTIVVANGAASSPISPSDAAIPGSSGGDVEATFFNGDDSVVLFAGASQAPGTIIDAISFTDEANEGDGEGQDKSFVRLTTSPGYDLVAGSNVTSFPSVWGEVTLATVNSASPGDDEFLGSSALGNPPPTVSFTSTSFVEGEDVGTVDLTLQLLDPDGTEVSVDVAFVSGSSTGILADIDSYTTQTVVFPSSAASGATQTVTVTITDDGDEEPTETAVFALVNLQTTGSAVIGSASQATVTIQDNDTPIPNLFISEVADPGDDPSARFVEIYNPTSSPIDLTVGNWNLLLYFNANATPGATIALTGTIPANGTYVIGQGSFEGAYGTPPNATGNINANGDDNYELRFGGDAVTGILVDVYGQPGTDGSGESWEFEDSRAVRLNTVTTGRTTFEASEWAILGANVANATPGVHPETILTPPTNAVAQAQGASAINISFTPSDGNDVVLIFSTTQSFTAPTGATPTVGDSFAGGTVLSVGTTSPVQHTGLTASTNYFYALYSNSGTDYSAGVFVSVATDAFDGLINSEDFEGTPGWVNQSLLGADLGGEWRVEEGEMVADGFDVLVNQAHYLVSPEFDFTSASNVVIEFDYGESQTGPTLGLFYSTDYSGTGAPTAGGDTWTLIPFTFEEDLSNPADTFTSFSAQVELPEILEGESSVYLSFLYTSDGTVSGSRIWFIDNIVVRLLPDLSDPLQAFLNLYGLTSADFNDDSGDNDGLVVLLEYLLNSNPNEPTRFAFEAGLYDLDGPDSYTFPGTDYLGIRFTSPRDGEAESVVISLIGSDDLGITDAFAAISFDYVGPTNNGDGTFTHHYVQSTPISDPDAKPFIQLQVVEDVE